MDDAQKKMIHYAYSLLARREYSVFELTQKMYKWSERHLVQTGLVQAKNLDVTGLITSIIAELKNKSYICDKRFAKIFFEQKQQINGWGQKKIWQKLREKGIDETIFYSLLEEISNEGFSSKIHQDVQKKWIYLVRKKKNDFEIKNALLRFLAGRGFGYQESLKLLAQVKKSLRNIS